MHRHRRLPLVLLPGLFLAGCAGDIDFAPFGRTDPIGAPDSLTVRRVMGAPESVPALLAEPGDVWPAQEAPRATLQNPEAVSSQGQQPSGILERARQRGAPPSSPPLRSEQPGPYVPPEAAPNPRAPLPGTRRGSSAQALPPLDPPPVPRAGVPEGEPPTPPARRLDGRVVPVPGGPPAILGGGTGGITTYTQPGGASGTAIQQPGSTTLFGPTGGVQVVPTP
ncbi:hypothetical protein [Muricoccus vinaceus]|uniref:Uncharacterized protein n=1 Tax=Muricoccus vinaceus TaxID=424704 RepID=A0ABV6IMW0_9PROT